jgi:non-ribosomal peptide synthetase component F
MKDEKVVLESGFDRDRELRNEMAAAAGTYIEEKKYWLEKLSGEPVKSSFPYDGIEEEAQSSAAEPVSFRITGELFSRLEQLGNRSDARLHMVLTAAVVILLYRHTGNNDIIVGMPVYRQDVEGEFVNRVLALRNRVSRDTTFKDLLFQVRQTVKEAVKNQNYPIEILVEQLGRCTACENETFPLFDTAVLLENIHDKHYLSRLTLGLIFSFRRTGESLEVELDYHPAFYRRESVEVVGRRFMRLLDVVNNVEMPAANIDILPPEEKELLSAFSNGAESDFPTGKTLVHLFREHAEQEPERDAVACGLFKVDYRWLEENSNHLAGYLAANSIGAGERVGVLLDRNIPAVVAILSTWKVGAAYVPLDPELPEMRLITMIEDAGIGMVLSERKYIKTLNRLQWACKGFHTFFS